MQLAGGVVCAQGECRRVGTFDALSGSVHLLKMVADSIPQLKSLSLAKKRRLIAELLDEVYGVPVEEREIVGALNTRVEHFRQNPGSARSWDGVKARLKKKK
jgi:hypothetical protein